jgi:HK97 family phage major capsid protein
MPNILELRRRATEVKTEAAQALVDVQSGKITQAEFTQKMLGNGGLVAKDKEISDGLKAYGASHKFDGMSSAVTQSQVSGFRGKAHQYAPIDVPTESLKSMHGAIASQSPFAIKTKSFSTVDSLLPSELQSSVVGPQHETRLLDRLPVLPTSAPSIEYIRHLSTTGVPAITAEGQPKPELQFNTDRVIVAAQKIACHAALSWETLNDWDVFASYFTNELQRQVIDAENNELLNGDGTTGHLTGLLNTSGILSHATSTDTGLDSVELSIAALRTGTALAEANLLVLNPTTWSALRRSKDTQGRYLVDPDPTNAAGNQLWGVEVLPTTTIAAGVGALVDTRKLGYVVVRESLLLRTGTNADDFSRNLVRWVAEERLALAVERPAAVCKITGLPTT